MEKTIKCPECGDQVTPDSGLCPICHYKFHTVDYTKHGMKEEDFTGVREIKISSEFFGKVKVFGFLLVVFIIIFMFFHK